MDNAEMPEEIDAERENVLEWLDWLQSEDHGWLTGRHGKAIEIIRRVFRTKTQDAEREKEEQEAYEIGKRDGYEEAVQDIDLMTGGDGEYRWSDDPERSCPDADTMKGNILGRFQSPPDITAVREVLPEILPVDVKIGVTTFRKGVKTRLVLDKIRRMDGGENG